MVVGEKDVAAYVAGAIGINSFLVRTRATAVAGMQSYCDASEAGTARAAAGCVPGLDQPVRRATKPIDTGVPWVFGGSTRSAVQQQPRQRGLDRLGSTRPAARAMSSARSSPPTTRRSTCPPGSTSPRPATRTAAAGALYARGGHPGARGQDRPGAPVRSHLQSRAKRRARQQSAGRRHPTRTTGVPQATSKAAARTSGHRMPSFVPRAVEPLMTGCDGLHAAYLAGNNSAI